MKILRTALVCLFCLNAVALAQDVKYDYDRGTTFSQFKTYKWVKIPSAVQLNQLQEQNVMRAVDEQLASKGLTKTDGDAANLAVAYQASIDKEKQIQGWGGGAPRFRGYGQATTSTIQIGTLVIDIYKAADKQLVWRGSATKTLNPSKDPDKNYKNLQKAMEKLFKNYPPNSK